MLSDYLHLGNTEGLQNTNRLTRRQTCTEAGSAWLFCSEWLLSNITTMPDYWDSCPATQTTTPTWEIALAAFRIYSTAFKFWYIFYLYLSLCAFSPLFQDDSVNVFLHNNLIYNFTSNILQFSTYLMFYQKLSRQERSPSVWVILPGVPETMGSAERDDKHDVHLQ